ncbi:MAG TPA: hypothetical protein VGO61_07695 [Steroidobacteraceae bacterium]|jgi:hypothetical protein|nr:hypothetical protein [Steroidobacteraceae bacterium]
MASLLLSSCAALPDDAAVVEQLDTETGVTVTRLGRPIELYRETFLQEAAGKFAFLGPFETNLMGQRELFLWLALPVEPLTDSVPAVEVNGASLALGTPGRAADFAGVHQQPYKIPTPWSAMYYFKIDAAIVAQLGEATDINIHVAENAKNGTVKTLFAARLAADTRLKDFAAR